MNAARIQDWFRDGFSRFERFAWSMNPALRKSILIGAAVAFFVGCVISLRQLDISPDSLRFRPLLLLGFILVPLTIIYSALNMMLMGRASSLRITLVDGIKVSAFAQVAEMLPIPGGAIVRTAALVKAGGSGLRSTGLVLSFAVLWVACGAIAGGIALAGTGIAAVLLLAAGSAIALAAIGWLGWNFDWETAILATFLRVLGVALVGCRMMVAFAAIGVTVSWLQSLTFAFTVILGSAASIIPAGLGVGEGLSALVAATAGFPAAAAFLAAALNRVIGLAGHLLVAAIFCCANLAK